MIDHVVQFSGGVSSWAAARIVKDELMADRDRLTLLFADTLIEDEDTYRFIEAAGEDLETPVTRISEGKTPWDVFKEQRFLGNSRIDPCSKYLKREPLRRYIDTNFSPPTTVIYLGIDWTEIHRLERARPRWAPWKVEAPLVHKTYSKLDLLNWAADRGLPSQRLYEMGMPHANCGGGCVKAGQGHFAKLLEQFPDRYAEWEQNEQEIREYLDKPVSILRQKGDPLTLADLRTQIQAGGQQLDLLDFGGCGCAID